MRTPVRIAVIAGVLIVAACTIAALLFVRSTQMRLDRLEEYLDGRREVRTSQYEQQQRELDDLRGRLCRIDPASCTP